MREMHKASHAIWRTMNSDGDTARRALMGSDVRCYECSVRRIIQ